MAIAEWIVWLACVIITALALLDWIGGLRAGTLNVGAAVQTPWVVLAQTIALMLILFSSWNKLHLLWL